MIVQMIGGPEDGREFEFPDGANAFNISMPPIKATEAPERFRLPIHSEGTKGFRAYWNERKEVVENDSGR